MSYLIYCDLVGLGRRDLLGAAAAWFGAFILFWLYCLFSFPPDLISQWIPYLPQTILWWIIARHLLRDGFGEPSESMLRSDVCRLERRSNECMGRSDVDDSPPLALFHRR